jgi:hypothetical protein
MQQHAGLKRIHTIHCCRRGVVYYVLCGVSCGYVAYRNIEVYKVYYYPCMCCVYILSKYVMSCMGVNVLIVTTLRMDYTLTIRAYSGICLS